MKSSTRTSFTGTLFVLMAVALNSCSTAAPVRETPRITDTSGQIGGQLAGKTMTDNYWKKIVDATLPSISKVDSVWCDYTGSGSGFFVNGIFVTNRHVIEDASNVSIELANGRESKISSWGWSKTEDLAWLIPSKMPTVTNLVISDSAAIPGNLVVGVGFPLGGKKTVQRGRVFDLQDSYDSEASAGKIIRSTNETLPGDSGGPLIDTEGHVAGVVFAIDLRENLTLAISGKSLLKFLSHLPAAKSPVLCP